MCLWVYYITLANQNVKQEFSNETLLIHQYKGFISIDQCMTTAEPELTTHAHTHTHVSAVCVHRKALDWMIKCMSELRSVSDTSV